MSLDLQTKYPDAEWFIMGDSEAFCQRLVALVRSRKKTATCGALKDFEANNLAMPVVGRRDIVQNWDKSPALVVQTTDVTICRLDEVSEDFALAEGENETRAGWAKDHIAFFKRGSGFSEKMMLVCERFKVIEDLAELPV